MAKRRKQHREEHIDETWLIPYADLLTLLLALFIVLFASSAIDVKKFDQMVRSLNVAFNGGLGVLEHPSPVPLPQEISQQSLLPLQQGEHNREWNEEAEAYVQETRQLQELKSSLDGYIKTNELSDKLQTKMTDLGLMITILDNALFESGSAEVRPDARKLAVEIARLLATDPPRQVVISGHTDNVPIHTPEFPSNWDLSAKRALNFMKVLLDNEKLDPRRFSVMGYGEYQPIADNRTAEGRAKNRRVEVLILRNEVQPGEVSR